MSKVPVELLDKMEKFTDMDAREVHLNCFKKFLIGGEEMALEYIETLHEQIVCVDHDLVNCPECLITVRKYVSEACKEWQDTIDTNLNKILHEIVEETEKCLKKSKNVD